MNDKPQPNEPGKRNPAGELHAQFRATRADIERQFEARKQQFDETNERIKAKTGRNLLGAIAIGLFLGGLLLVSLLVTKELFMLFAGVLLGLSSVELALALRKRSRHVAVIPSTLTTLAAVPAAFYWGMVGALAVVFIGVIITIVWRAIEARGHGSEDTDVNLSKDALAAIFVQGYVTILGSFAVALVALPGGQWWTLAFIIVVVSVDTGAYASGLLFGKHPMAPTISPKKTWEGFAGAALAALIAAILLSIFMLGEAWWFGIIFGILILISATGGDLLESQIKRLLGVKDMSSWLAGHGGYLDRLDSILPSSLVAYVLYAVVVGI